MKRLIKFLLPVITIPSVLVYLMACLTPYMPPYNFWPLTFLTIVFPFIAFGIGLLFLVWLFVNKRIALVVFLLLLVGYKNLNTVFAVSFPSSFNYAKDSSVLRVLTWNVQFFGNPSRYAESDTGKRRRMINFIKKANADVLLFQEFREIKNPAIFSNVEVLRDTLGYKYWYVNNDWVAEYPYGKSYEGSAIFSKYPLSDTGKLPFPNLVSNESIAYADINVDGKKVHLFTTHLLSMSLFNSDEVGREGIFINRNRLVRDRSRFRLLKRYDSIHSRQAEFFAEAMSRSTHPVILSGDFNSVPTSYVYHTIKGKLQDAFLKEGFGFGQTYLALSPTLRIDYLFADKNFKVVQVASPAYHASDHFPIVADFHFR